MIKQKFLAGLSMAVFGAGIFSSHAATVVLDGNAVTKLSQAVNLAQAADSGPHTINITTNTVALDDGFVYITNPVTINGDADNDGVKCDILVDINALRGLTAPAAGVNEKAYITVQTSQTVSINNLQIHPNADGVDASFADVTQRVDGVRCLKPELGSAGTYTFTKVFISGSDSDNAYIPLDTGDDIYTSASKLWSSSGTGSQTAQAVVQWSNQGPNGNSTNANNGTYAATLEDCHIGLGKSSAVQSTVSGAGQRRILGGVYGHCGTDGIRISGTTFRIVGTPTNRVRVLRSTNISGGDAHAIEVDGGGVQLMEYVDVATMNTAQGLKLNGAANVTSARFVRILGKFTPTANASIYLNGNGTGTANSLLKMTNSTVVGYGANYNPFQSNTNVNAAAAGDVAFTDTIFTSENLGRLIVDRFGSSTYVPEFKNCALPTDGVTSESLSTTGAFFGGVAASIVPVNSVTVSPNYLLTLADYDWSDNQGTGKPGNGPGNVNVLRPSNPAYVGASSAAANLDGGAGPAAAGIARETWMLL